MADFDLIVIGAGSGGIGAAISAARLGLRVALVEKADQLGGNAVRGGVNVWEMGAGGTGLPFDIYRRLRAIPRAVGVYSFGRHFVWPLPDGQPPFPGGEHVIDPHRGYIHTLRRHGCSGMRDNEAWVREHWHGVVFEPEAYCDVVETMCREIGRISLLKGRGFKRFQAAGRRVTAVTLSDGATLTADAFVDGTADALAAIALGCETRSGQEARATYGEADAPDQPTDRVNAVTLVYRVAPINLATDIPSVESAPDDASLPADPEDCWWADRFPAASVSRYPNGDRNVNMLPTMQGREFLGLAYAQAYAECRRRVWAHWRDMQTRFPEFRMYRMQWIAPGLGVRESRRLVGRYVLNQRDLEVGLSGQTHDDIICLADHAMDVHGEASRRRGCGELNQPYGVPLRCLLPREYDNLLVACRGASFSAIGASSCRLSRTMMQLGQAAGIAVAVAREAGAPVGEVDAQTVRDALRAQHVQLEHPWPAELERRLRSADP